MYTITFDEFVKKDTDPYENEYELGNSLAYTMYADMMARMEKEREEYRNKNRQYLTGKRDFTRDVKLEECDALYCKRYLRQGRGEEFGERNCKFGNRCFFSTGLANSYPDQTNPNSRITNHQSHEAFVCREFLLPSQEKYYKEQNGLPVLPRACLGCNRFLTSLRYLYYKMHNCEAAELLQDHYNKVSDDPLTTDPTCYNIDNCLYPNSSEEMWLGIARPILKFNAHNYIYSKTEDLYRISKKSPKKEKLKCVKESNLFFQ